MLLVNDNGSADGGAELRMIALRDGLRRRGHQALLFSSRATLVPGWPTEADETCFGTTTRLQVLVQTANLSAYLRLRQVLAEFRPDVVHVRMFQWQLSPLILPLLKNVPSLYQAAAYKDLCPKGSKLLPDGSQCRERAGVSCLRYRCVTAQTWAPLMIQIRLLRRWHHAFDRVVVLSGPMRELLEAEGFGPVTVMHNGVPERLPRPPLADPPMAAYAGRLTAEKGVDVLLRAFARLAPGLPKAGLLIAGRGAEAGALEHLAHQLGIAGQVTFLGHQSREEMERRFDPVWVQCVPSLWEEPFGNVTTEAMMRGTAVVASDVGGQREIVRHSETGFLVPPGDVDALTEALQRVLGDRALAERLGDAGRFLALDAFSEERVIDRFVGLYEEIAGGAVAMAG